MDGERVVDDLVGAVRVSVCWELSDSAPEAPELCVGHAGVDLVGHRGHVGEIQRSEDAYPVRVPGIGLAVACGGLWPSRQAEAAGFLGDVFTQLAVVAPLLAFTEGQVVLSSAVSMYVAPLSL